MSFDQVPAWSVGSQLLIAGAAAFVVVERVGLARRAGRDRSAPWLAGLAFVLSAGLLSNVWMLSSPAHRIDQIAFVRSVLLVAAAIVLVPVAARLAGVHVPRWTMLLLGCVGAVRLVLWPMSEFVSRHDVASSGMLRYGSLVAVTAAPAALLVVAGLVSVWSRWDDRVERATFAAGVGGAIAILVASFLVEPVLAELLTGWGSAPLVVAVVAIVLRQHRHRDERLDVLEVETAVAGERIGRLAVRSDLACEVAEVAWWEYQPASGRFVASGAAWELLADGRVGTERRHDDEGRSLDSVLQSLRVDARLSVKRTLLTMAADGRVDARVPLHGNDDRWIDVSASVADTDPAWVVGVASDASADQRALDEAAAQHRRGLHVGAGAVERIGRVCDGWLAAGRTVFVLVVEVRGLDRVGMVLGDRGEAAALDSVLQRLGWARPVGAHVARLSDRHLVSVVPASDGALTADPMQIAASIHALFDRPVSVGVEQVHLSASIGIAAGPDDGSRFGLLAARARAVAARTGTPSATSRFVPGDVDAAEVALHTDAHVAWAIRHDAIHVAYQPVVSARSGEIRSAEALVRCWHPELGDLPSEQIVAAAASQGAAAELFGIVLRQALTALRRWRSDGLLESVSVNLAPSLLSDPRTFSLVERELVESGVPSDSLVLELTEHVGLEGLAADAARFQALGVRLAIDDFGVGRSTVGRLAGMPIDLVKLDRSLVSGLHEDERRERVVALANDVAHHLGALVIAEGVETEPEASALRDVGIDGLQGYGLCRPLPFAELSAYLAEMRAARGR